MFHEMRSKQKEIEKEQKLAQFQSKTKANIMRKQREQKPQLTDSEKKKQLARENALKAKQFSQQHRKIVANKGVTLTVKSKSGSQIQASASKESKDGSESGYGYGTQVHKQFVEQSQHQMAEPSGHGIVSIEGSQENVGNTSTQ